MKPLIVAIDGPSGAGKSSIGKMLACALGALYIDSGAMYRAVALAVLEHGIGITDSKRVIAVAKDSLVSLSGEPASLKVSLNGRDVTTEIRGEEVTNAASVISTIPEVRQILVERQREVAAGESVVMDGRDIGTVVFPHADFKFFLTASPEMRARRRLEEELARNRNVTYDEVLADIAIRDKRDSTRTASPLVPAPDAIIVDSSNLSMEEVLEEIKLRMAGSGLQVKECST
jgi:cytidylate kinase